MNERAQKLLSELAEGFEDGTDLLMSTEWLRENEVTLDELHSLSRRIANLLRSYLYWPEEFRLHLEALGVSWDGVDAHRAQSMRDTLMYLAVQKYMDRRVRELTAKANATAQQPTTPT
jgi:hypothetical protein